MTALLYAFNKEKTLEALPLSIVKATVKLFDTFSAWILGTDRYGSFSKWVFSLRPQRSDLQVYSLSYGGSQSNGLQIFSSKNTQWDFKKNLFLRSNHLVDQEKRKMMSLFWNFIQNGMKRINKTYNLNHNRIVREETQQVVK